MTIFESSWLQIFSQKQPKYSGTFWATLKNVTFEVKCCCVFFGHHGKIWATFTFYIWSHCKSMWRISISFSARRLGQEHPPLSTTCVTRFGIICKIFKTLGKILTVFFLFGKMLSVLWQNFDIANGQILKNTTTQSCAFPFALEHTGSKERGSVHLLQIWHKSGKVTEALNTFAAAPWALKKHYHRKVVFVHLKSSGILSLECTVFCSTFWGVDIYAIKLFFLH